MLNQAPLIIFFVGFSKSGKTTTIERLIQELPQYHISTIKFMHHPDITIDPSAKDSQRHRQAGALFTLCFAPKETALIIKRDKRDTIETVHDFLKLSTQVLPSVDILFCEGLKDVSPGSPIVLSGRKKEDLEFFNEKLDKSQIIAISGKISQHLSSWKGIPVIDIFKRGSLQKLASIIINQMVG
ncbi:MAG: molybdopterin-guanine dinucleotide biosynthesis protein B [Candidatus Hodarchaeales archaeon]|jgi:molybdopterin-guanine dinucleotide biosynthesis protein MobB